MSPRLKEFTTAVLLDLAENCDWTISPTGQIEHSPFFEYAEKHLHIIETELADMREMFRELIPLIPTASCEMFHHKKKDQHAYDEECKPLSRYNAKIQKAKEALGL